VVLKNNINLLLLIIISGCMTYAARLNDIPAVSKGDILFYIDYSAFKGSSEKENHVEFYLMLFADQLQEVNGNFSFIVNTVLMDNYKREINRKRWETEASKSADMEARTLAIYDQWNETLPPGDYTISVAVQDKNSGKKGEVNYKFKHETISGEKFGSSDIEFASRIETTAENNHFRKGNVSVIPNPSRRYGVLNPILYIYYELYKIDLEQNDTLSVKYTAVSKIDQSVKKFPPVKISIKKSSTAITHGLNVDKLSSGIYDLSVNITGNDNTSLLNFSRQFEIIQKDFAAHKSSFTAEDAQMFENILTVIGTESQLKNYQRLTLSAKGSYVVEFWRSMDPSPGTPDNEFLNRIQQRYIYANDNFRWGKTEGWNTDRGRVMIKYGVPDEIDHQSSRPDMAPYEIWIYRQEKKFIFVFGDPQNNGRFILLHSDKEGEIYNTRWKEYLIKM
jgi:GWxTD domain-containing protein